MLFSFRKFPFITTCRGVASVSPEEASPQVNKREYFLTKDHRLHLDDDYNHLLDDDKYLLQKRQDDQEDLEVSKKLLFLVLQHLKPIIYPAFCIVILNTIHSLTIFFYFRGMVVLYVYFIHL